MEGRCARSRETMVLISIRSPLSFIGIDHQAALTTTRTELSAPGQFPSFTPSTNAFLSPLAILWSRHSLSFGLATHLSLVSRLHGATCAGEAKNRMNVGQNPCQYLPLLASLVYARTPSPSILSLLDSDVVILPPVCVILSELLSSIHVSDVCCVCLLLSTSCAILHSSPSTLHFPTPSFDSSSARSGWRTTDHTGL